MHNKQKLWLKLFLLPIDYLAVFLATIGAYFLRLNWPWKPVIYIQPLNEYILIAALTAIAALIVFAFFGLYDFRRFNAVEKLTRITGGVSVWIALLIIVLFLLRITFFSRLVMGLTWVLAIIAVFLFRSFYDYFKGWLARFDFGTDHVLLAGTDPETLKKIEGFLQERPGWGLKIKSRTEDIDPRGIREKIDSDSFDRLIIAESIPKEHLSSLFALSEEKGIRLSYFPSLTGLLTQNVIATTLAGYPTLELRSTPLEGWGRIMKRVIDVILASIGIVIASPLLLIVAVAIKLDSEGPALYKQTRIGERGTKFTFYKFRSMYTELSTGDEYGGEKAKEVREKLKEEQDEGPGVLFKVKDDPRVTPVGKFIRKTSLDELPQLFNVLKGNMSLVGPRPPLPDEVEKYSKKAERRLLIKPGITGLWQISGRVDLSFEEYLKLDLHYIENWSVWLDFWIIIKTVGVLITKKGGY